MLYFEDLRAIRRHLGVEQMGALFVAAVEYAEAGVAPDFQDPLLAFAWDSLAPRLDRDRDAYLEKVAANRAKAMKRWHGDPIPKDAGACHGISGNAGDANTSSSLNSSHNFNSSTSTSPNLEGCCTESVAVNKLEETGIPLSSTALKELQDFESFFGKELCLRAIEEAAEHDARSWGYVRAILQRWRSEGIRTPADLEKRKGRPERDALVTDAFDTGDIDWMFGGVRTDGKVVSM